MRHALNDAANKDFNTMMPPATYQQPPREHERMPPNGEANFHDHS